MQTIAKLPCPRHVDKTPSLAVADNGWAHCFSCGWNIPSNRLPGFEKEPEPGEEVEEGEKYVEDIEASIRRIEALPRQRIRGLVLPYDGNSYYIVFPDRNYYRRRFHAANAHGGKYRSPAGVSRPAFVLKGADAAGVCLFVEGEINALSIKEVCPEITVCCPGGAADFANAGAIYREHIRGAARIIGIADRDAAGAGACLALVAQVWPRKVELQLWSTDANDLLIKGQLRERIRLALSGQPTV